MERLREGRKEEGQGKDLVLRSDAGDGGREGREDMEEGLGNGKRPGLWYWRSRTRLSVISPDEPKSAMTGRRRLALRSAFLQGHGAPLEEDSRQAGHRIALWKGLVLRD